MTLIYLYHTVENKSVPYYRPKDLSGIRLFFWDGEFVTAGKKKQLKATEVERLNKLNPEYLEKRRALEALLMEEGELL